MDDIEKFSYLLGEKVGTEQEKKILSDLLGYSFDPPIVQYYKMFPSIPDEILLRMVEKDEERNKTIDEINNPLLSRQERRKIERRLWKSDNNKKLKDYKNNKKKRK